MTWFCLVQQGLDLDLLHKVEQEERFLLGSPLCS